jgi:hypothetical protein
MWITLIACARDVDKQLAKYVFYDQMNWYQAVKSKPLLVP